MYSKRISMFFYELRNRKYNVWLRDGDFFRYLEDMNFGKKNVESQKKLLNQAKKLLLCSWEDPYFGAMRKYDDEYYVRVYLSAPLYGRDEFTVKKHHIRSTADENVRRQYVLHRGETDLSDREVVDLLMKELKEALAKPVPMTIKKIRKDINEFIEKWS